MLAGTAVVLSALLLPTPRPQTWQGLHVIVPRTCTVGDLNPHIIEDGDEIVLVLSANGTSLNEDKYSPSVVPERVAQIMHRRQTRLLFVVADRQSSYGSLVQLMAETQKMTPDLKLILLPPFDENRFAPLPCSKALAEALQPGFARPDLPPTPPLPAGLTKHTQ